MEILILESKKKYLETMENVLSNHGNLHIYTSFNKCIVDVRNRKNSGELYDLAVLDLDLPGGSALQLLKELRTNISSSDKSNMKVLLLSESLNTSTIMDFFSLPEDICMLKTSDREEFLNYLKKIGCI